MNKKIIEKFLYQNIFLNDYKNILKKIPYKFLSIDYKVHLRKIYISKFSKMNSDTLKILFEYLIRLFSTSMNTLE